MERAKYRLDHEWHVAINRHQDQRDAGKDWAEARFMHEAKSMRFNVEGNRAATLAVKPPPKVAGPCWPYSLGATFALLSPFDLTK